ncbi:MAG: sigma-70 family RNA polymerase sigma factor [Oscillospiraceae bacterium]|nr:sigma-70 family RNA polymerase sigma factor [Oscillospiraceae bacterium]
MNTDCLQSAQRYTRNMYRLAFSYCRNREDAEDVVQEVFLKLLRQKSEFLDEQKLRSWLLKVTVNACMDLLRSPWRGRCCALEEATEPTVLMQEESELMLAVLNLPAKYRGVIHLYYYEDYSITEIAGILNVSESAVRMRLMRARQKLKEQLGGTWSDE